MIQHDSSSGAFSVDGGAGTFNWQVGAGMSPVGTPVVAFVMVMFTVDAVASGSVSLDSVTYGGVAMTRLTVQSLGGSTLEYFVLLNPPTGPQNAFLNFSNDDGATDIVGFANCTLLSSSIGGTAQLSVATIGSGTSNAMTQNVTGLSTNNLWVHQYGTGTGASFVTTTVVGTGETRRAGNASYGDGVFFQRGQFNVTTQLSLAGTVTPRINLSASRSWKIISVEVKEIAPVQAGHILTSYETGIFPSIGMNVEDIALKVTPEQQQKIWRGDRRYYQGPAEPN
jgi:hypothetical protein